MDTTADNVVEATAATHSAASATPAATAATKSRTLMESFREAGEKLLFDAVRKSKAVGMNYFVELEHPSKQGITDICTLCTRKESARVNLKSTSNAKKHLDLNHPGWTSSAPAQPRPAHSIINAFQRANSAAVDTRTSEQRARAELLSKTLRLIRTRRIDYDLLLPTLPNRRLPYSMTGWEDLLELIEVCLLLPSRKVRLRKIDRYKLIY